MSSSAQIGARAMRRLGLLSTGEDPSAADAAEVLAALNAMLAGWQADGINVSPDVPLPAKYEEGVVALLAVRIASDFGRAVPEGVASDAARGMRRLEAGYISAPLARFDCALTSMPSQGMTIGAVVDDWAASTAYDAGDRRLADDRNIYECIVAGTSASTGSGPHGTGPDITDGTARWRFVGFNS